MSSLRSTSSSKMRATEMENLTRSASNKSNASGTSNINTPSSGSQNPAPENNLTNNILTRIFKQSYRQIKTLFSHWLVRAAVVLWVFSAGFSHLILALEEGLLYHPRSHGAYELKSWMRHSGGDGFPGLGYVLQKWAFGDGQYGYLVLPSGEGVIDLDRVWLVIGGNAMIATDWLEWVREFYLNLQTNPKNKNKKIGFLLLDFPGYGESKGKPSPKTSLEQHKLAYVELQSYLKKRVMDFDNLKFGFLGHSLGCAALSQLAANFNKNNNELQDLDVFNEVKQPDKLILSSPFLSIPHMAQIVFPFLSPRYAKYFVTHDWDNQQNFQNLPKHIKLSIIHSMRDEICPFFHSKQMIKIAKKNGLENVKFLEKTQGGHNDLIWVERWCFFDEMLE